MNELDHMTYLQRRIIERAYMEATHEVVYICNGVTWKERFTHDSSALRYAERMLAREDVTSVTITKL